jgi:drug/metabolite transporter (DMT)-like permease
MQKWTAILIVLIGGASYGILATFVKIGYAQGFTVSEVTGSQLLIGVILMWLIALYKKGSWTRIPIRTWLKIMTVGSLFGVTAIFYYTSLLALPASIAIILLFQFVWIGLLYEWLMDRKKPSLRSLLSVLLIFIGTVLAANLVAGDFGQMAWWGILTGFGSAFSYAGFIYVSGRIAVDVSPWLRSPIMISGACIVVFLVFPPAFMISGALFEGLIIIGLIIAFFGAVVPTICFTYGVPKVGVGLSTILSSIELPVAVLMAWLILKENVSFLQWLGIGVIMLAIVLERK